jgi:hypothetical protein
MRRVWLLWSLIVTLGWRTGLLGGVPVVFHPGDHPNMHTLVFIQPETRRGAVLLMNSQNMLAQFGASKEIEAGVARLLAGQEPAASSALSLITLYLLLDAVLVQRLGPGAVVSSTSATWSSGCSSNSMLGSLRLSWIGLQLGWEFALPLTLLLGARLLLHGLGAQSWSEGLLLFPDFGPWLWAFSLLMLLFRVIRLRPVMTYPTTENV